MSHIRIILLLTLAATGCQVFQRGKEVQTVRPVLSAEMTREELVQYLNSQSEGLRNWRCNDTVVEVNLPKLPDQRLKGTFHCSWPSHFRLDAGNLIGIQANLGSNDDICWAYFQPGEPMVLTWKHQDAYLLQYLPDGIPRLEPEWLLTILGIQPLDLERYQLTRPPEGSRELWLAAIENAPDGSSLRRVIKVDTVNGVAREHALYDRNGNFVLRAQLKDHKMCGHYRLPHTVAIDFPANKTRLTLRFSGIQPDCDLSDSLWQPPHSSQIQSMDVGAMIRERIPSAEQHFRPAEYASEDRESPAADHRIIEDPFTGVERSNPQIEEIGHQTISDAPDVVPVPEFDLEPERKKSRFRFPFSRR
ncbi:MAG: hypothetical protein ACK58L_02885 [Planctomycetota bacterium]